MTNVSEVAPSATRDTADLDSSRHSYAQIVKSSSIRGGSQAIILLISVVQTKFAAVYLGPLGVGLLGTYGSLMSLVGTIAGLGIGSSGVREVAAAIGSQDNERIGRTILALRRVCWITGLAGAVGVMILSQPLSLLTFGSTDHAWALAVLGICILLQNITSAQLAFLQGKRLIAEMALRNILGASAGAIIGIGYYANLGVNGIVPAMVTMAVTNLIFALGFARRFAVPKVNVSWWESLTQSGGLIRLGIAFAWVALVTNFVAYGTRLLIGQKIGLEAVGVFQSSFALSGQFAQFILGAMAFDYFPRLAEASTDHKRMNQLVNEQTEVGLVIALPGLVATMAFAPLIIQVFYSAKFAQSADLLPWFVLGCLGRVISWPIGFIIPAIGKAILASWIETVFGILHLVSIWLGLRYFGLFGVAVAFVFVYVTYIIVMAIVGWKLTGFRWTPVVLKLMTVVGVYAGGAFLSRKLLPEPYAVSVGLVIIVLSSLFSLRELTRRLGPKHRISKWVLRIPLLRKAVPNICTPTSHNV